MKVGPNVSGLNERNTLAYDKNPQVSAYRSRQIPRLVDFLNVLAYR